MGTEPRSTSPSVNDLEAAGSPEKKQYCVPLAPTTLTVAAVIVVAAVLATHGSAA
jgi:hypothetical protein